ncbi:MAG: PEP-CTERM sorting domain-containing protein [Blastochloris sp.]|nr:PEP-CTERM sorting domain-containing protein [Blastochloris sp.]
MAIGAQIQNSSGLTLDSFTVTYDGELWRQGAGNTTLVFEYSLNATSITDSLATWTNVSALNFVSNSISGTPGNGNVDGNDPANRVAGITSTVVSLNITNGSNLWVRYYNTGASPDGLSVDNFQFTATTIPEPSTYALLGLGLGALWWLRRKSSVQG